MSRTVMLVDDSASVRTIMRMALERAGYDVVEADDGESACGILDGRAVGAVVCDLSMPRVDGFGLLQYLRQHPRYKYTPVVVLSTDARDESRARARTEGAQAFVQKPCRPAELVAVVSRLCH